MQPTQRSARLPRRVLVVVLAFYLLQLVVRDVWNEPYPGVFQPRFGVVPPAGTAVVTEPTVRATFVDGSTGTYRHWDVMAESQSSAFETFRSAFGPESPRRESEQNIAWLGRRLAELNDGTPAAEAVIAWDRVTYSLAEEERTSVRPVDRYHVDFGPHDG